MLHAPRTSLRAPARGKALTYRFVCKLRKGAYRVAFSAVDAAGNRQTKVARATLTVK